MSTLAAALTEATLRLKGSDSPRLDAELLLAHALRVERSYLLAHPERALGHAEAQRLADLVAARARGEPIAYLTGEREFWSLQLAVTPATLIPRPETELLVEQALTLIPPAAEWEILDLGTGGGAIALAIATERPRCRIVATDLSDEALGVARANAKSLGLHNVEFIQGGWFDAVPERCFKCIVSNPPYVAEADPHLSQGDLRFEPRSALVAGLDGLDALRGIIATAPSHLHKDGALLFEHGSDQGLAVRGLLHARGFAHSRSFRDLSGHERVSGGDWVNTQPSG